MVIATRVAVPSAQAVREAVRVTFEIRRTPVPSVAPALPGIWEAELRQFLTDYPLNGVADDANELFGRFSSFWDPVLAAGAKGRWDPTSWTWRASGNR